VQALVRQRLATPEALPAVERLYAFGVLIANTDMHMGNLSFFSTAGQPCTLAPAYDMLPMALAPTAAGALRDTLPPLQLPASVPLATWHPALALAREWLARLEAAALAGQVSAAFSPARAALQARLAEAAAQVARIAP
jgi:serine/threonine protein kinase HipA of HipAB toxin-antitoxin module